MLSESSKNRLKVLAGLLSEGGGVPRSMSYTSRYNAKYRNNKNYPFHKSLKKEEIIADEDLNEISPEDISVPKEFIHHELNQQVWAGETLKPEVRKRLVKIAQDFYAYLEIKAPIAGIKLIGSMANYNWSSQSDLDVHLFFDFKDINQDHELVKNYFFSKKALWNEHHNIIIKGFPVELYAQDINDKPHSAAIYDLVKGDWEVKPSHENFTVDKTSLIVKITSLINCIEELDNNNLPGEEKFERGQELKEKLRRMRQSGLEQGGEFSIENLAFKFLRNNGYIEHLYTITKNAYDNSMSLTEKAKK